VVLCLQDTTELDFNGQGIAGLGPLSYEAQRGMYCTPDLCGQPGAGAAGVFGRLDVGEGAEGRRRYASRDQGERAVGEGYARVAESGRRVAADTGWSMWRTANADIRELMVARPRPRDAADWLLALPAQRALPEADGCGRRCSASPSLGEIRFTLPAAAGAWPARCARRLYAPARLLVGRSARDLRGHLPGRSRDRRTTRGQSIEWRLLTNRSAETLEAVVELESTGTRRLAQLGNRAVVLGAQGGLPRRGAATGHGERIERSPWRCF